MLLSQFPREIQDRIYEFVYRYNLEIVTPLMLDSYDHRWISFDPASIS